MRASMYGHFFVVQWLVEVAGAELDLQNDVSRCQIFQNCSCRVQHRSFPFRLVILL